MPQQQNAVADIDFTQPPPAAIDFTQPPPAAPPKPGFVQRFAESSGIPTSFDELEEALTPGRFGGLGVAAGYFGNLSSKVREAFDKPDLKSAMSAIAALTPGGELQKKFAQDLVEKNYSGAAGTASGVAAQFAAPELAERATTAAEPLLEKTSPYVKPVAKFAKSALDITVGDRIAKLYKAWQTMKAELPKPPAEVEQARGLATGGTAPKPEQAAALETIPNNYVRPAPELPEAFQPRYAPLPGPPGTAANPFQGPAAVPAATAPPGAAGSMAESIAQPAAAATPSGAGIPRTLSGESILGQVLGGRDQPTLLKIARSRGIDIAQEAQLKPGVANKRIIGKIISDFSPEELDEVRAQGLENSRFRHAFGDIGDEAWNTMALQTYFPDVKIPMAQILRTQKAVQAASGPRFGPVSDLATQLKESPAIPAKAKPPGSAGSLEDSLNEMLQGVKSGKSLKDLATQ